MNLRRWLAVASLSLSLGACSEKDKTAPPAPAVDPIASPTSKASIVVTGAAEYGATVTISGGAQVVEVKANDFTAEFYAVVPLNSTIPDGAVSVTNSLSFVAKDAAGNKSDATVVEVIFGPEPGVPAVLTFDLTGDANDGTINAGSDVTYSYTVTDAYGGAVLNPVALIVSWPNALVFDDGVSGTGLIMGMTQTGDFTVTARVTGAAGLSEVVPLTVTPSLGVRYVSLALTLSRMAVNDSVLALTVVKDLYGNVIVEDTDGTSANLTLACAPQNAVTPQAACVQAGNSFTITKAGVFKITATYDDTVNDVAAASQYIFVEDVPDVEPPIAAITSILFPSAGFEVARGSRIEAALHFSDNKGLADAVLYAVFGNNPACIAQSGALLLAGALSQEMVASVRLPNCAFPNDAITLFARVTDQAANLAYSPSNTALIVSNLIYDPMATSAGYSYTVFGYRDRINTPVDVAVDTVSGVPYVSDRNNNRLVAIFPDRTQADLRDIDGNTYGFNTIGGVAMSATGDFFVVDENNRTVEYIEATLPTSAPSPLLTLAAISPSRINFDDRPGTDGVLCVARTGVNESSTCYDFDASVPSLTSSFARSLPAGKTARAVDVGAFNTGTSEYTVWFLAADCTLYQTPALFDGSTPAAPTVVTVTGIWTGGSHGTACNDLVALPSGDVAILDSDVGAVVRVTPAGASSFIMTDVPTPTGLDFLSDQLFVLDSSFRTLFTVVSTGAGTAF